MKILFCATECVPYVKTGGLADVAGALPKALRDLGIDARVILPRHRAISLQGLNETIGGLPVPISSKTVYGKVFETVAPNGVPMYFVDQPHYFDRKELYVEGGKDYADNAERFVFFSRAIIEFIRREKFVPDIIHVNDWFTGLVPVYLRTLYSKDAVLKNIRTVFTIHNLAYQGVFWHYDMHLTGLPWTLFRFDKLEFYGKLNFMKGGLIFSERISTVSRRYAQEIQRPADGCGLDAVIRKRSGDLTGIVNGIDYDAWNPATDEHLAARFSPNDLEGKRACKREVQKLNNLPESDKPLFGIVSRLAEQKGFDLFAEIFDEMLADGAQFVLLGTGDKKYHDFFADKARRYPLQVGVNFVFSDPLAHKIEAGADIFLMPSRFEPCGLNQLYSMRYGTIPVAGRVGGLADTIEDGATGFLFENHSAREFLAAVRRAVAAYHDRDAWKNLQRNAMNADWSWERSAKEYAKLYATAHADVIPER